MTEKEEEIKAITITENGKPLPPLEIIHKPREKPEEIIAFGKEAADMLLQIVKSAKLSVKINSKHYLMFGGWQTIARFYGCTVGTEWTRTIKDAKDEIYGFEARAIVYDKTGRVISAAEAMCCRDEDNWRSKTRKPDFQLRSMAQTRANAKALRNVFSWVPVLAGFEETPAEEMMNENIKEVNPEEGRKVFERNLNNSSNTKNINPEGKTEAELMLEKIRNGEA